MVKSAKFFSVLADEVTSHNIEHGEICDHFVSFVKMDRVQAIDITEAIVNHHETLGLSLSHLRGQSYDGASTL